MTSRPLPATSEPTVYLVAVDGTPSDTHVLEVACGLGPCSGAPPSCTSSTSSEVPSWKGGVMTPGIVRTEEVEAEDRLAVDRSTAYAAAHFGGKIVGHACMLNVGDKPAHVAYPVATAPRGGG